MVDHRFDVLVVDFDEYTLAVDAEAVVLVWLVAVPLPLLLHIHIVVFAVQKITKFALVINRFIEMFKI